MGEEEVTGNVIALRFGEVTLEFQDEDHALPPQHRSALRLPTIPVYCQPWAPLWADIMFPKPWRISTRAKPLNPAESLKMEEDGFQLRVHQELQPADYPTSSLASLSLMEEAAVTSRSNDHTADNPEHRSGFPGMMSSSNTQSKQHKEGTNVESCPVVQGKV